MYGAGNDSEKNRNMFAHSGISSLPTASPRKRPSDASLFFFLKTSGKNLPILSFSFDLLVLYLRDFSSSFFVGNAVSGPPGGGKRREGDDFAQRRKIPLLGRGREVGGREIGWARPPLFALLL